MTMTFHSKPMTKDEAIEYIKDQLAKYSKEVQVLNSFEAGCLLCKQKDIPPNYTDLAKDALWDWGIPAV